MIIAGCRFSIDLAGFGGATTSRFVLLGVRDLLVRGDPSALVKKTIKKRVRHLMHVYKVLRQNNTNMENKRIMYSVYVCISPVPITQSKHT